MIILPASAETVLAQAVDIALGYLPDKMVSDQARVQVLGDGLYESGFRTRIQAPNGPAHGLWQFQINAIRLVMWNAATSAACAALCEACGVKFGPTAIYFAIADGAHDVLAAGLARLIVWADPQPLPAIGNAPAAADCHQRCYRPGAWDESRYIALYPQAVEAVA